MSKLFFHNMNSRTAPVSWSQLTFYVKTTRIPLHILHPCHRSHCLIKINLNPLTHPSSLSQVSRFDSNQPESPLYTSFIPVTGLIVWLKSTWIPLSLYSTRTQNTWRRGLALGKAPDARILRYPTQNIPTCWYILRWITHFFRVLPDAFYPTRFTRRQSVEYRWRWAFWRWGWRWACTFHIFCVDFICVW